MKPASPPDAQASPGAVPGDASPPGRQRRSWRGWWLRLGALTVLLLVFASYLSPHLAVDLANRLWACFG